MVNTYLVYDETKKAFIVDPGGYSRDLAEDVSRNDLSVEAIILTHGHGDHIGGIPKFRELYPKAEIIAAAAEKPLLEDPRKNVSPELLGRPLTIRADRFVHEGEEMTIGTMHLKFRMTPGHTPGGMIILLDHVVFSGDTLFQASVGRTDFPGGSFQDLVNSVREKLFTLPDDTVVLPGHMGKTTIGFEKENNPFV
jgi:hydroxyacylglutathione hydrolase